MDEDLASWDVVHTITDWYDGPREGAAEFQGRAYWYRSVYLDTSEWDPNEDRFELTRLTDDALSWEVETKRIFERWDSARTAGTIVWADGDESTFGAMPDEMQRFRELNEKLQSYFQRTKPELLVRGNFGADFKNVRWELIEPI